MSLLRPEKPLVSEAIDQESFTATKGLHAFYRAALPLSSRTLAYASEIIRRHRSVAGSRWRKLNPGKQALLVLANLRKGKTFAELAAGFGVGTATAWRYVNETVALLAACVARAGEVPLEPDPHRFPKLIVRVRFSSWLDLFEPEAPDA